jgi:hypothetical protein
MSRTALAAVFLFHLPTMCRMALATFVQLVLSDVLFPMSRMALLAAVPAFRYQ